MMKTFVDFVAIFVSGKRLIFGIRCPHLNIKCCCFLKYYKPALDYTNNRI